MVYQWKSGSQHRSDPQIAGEMCKKLEEQGRLTAKDLLDENRPKDAPLHNEFEWNDGKAAESWREHQARNIINSLIIVPEMSEPIRCFFKVERAESTYRSVSAIIQNEDTAQKLFEMAKRELDAIQKKYNSIHRLKPVWDAINAVR